MKNIRNNPLIKLSHEVMEACLKENVDTIEDLYATPLCSKPRDVLFPKEDVVYGQILIIQLLEKYCVIWLGREKGSLYRDPDDMIESYKVEVQWWKPT